MKARSILRQHPFLSYPKVCYRDRRKFFSFSHRALSLITNFSEHTRKMLWHGSLNKYFHILHPLATVFRHFLNKFQFSTILELFINRNSCWKGRSFYWSCFQNNSINPLGKQHNDSHLTFPTASLELNRIIFFWNQSGFYRGNVVALKKVYKRSIDLTRSIKKELKLMREVNISGHFGRNLPQYVSDHPQLRHENIAGFVGAAVEHSNIFILTNYSPRGSLENVLANKDLKLDKMFVSSLVFDIMKGLIFLHDSEIVSHGNLRSSNCLVDSRWCVKLTDFGLNEFKYGNDEPDK